MTEGKKKKSSRVINVSLLMASLVFSYGLSEVALRLVSPKKIKELTGTYYFDVKGSVYEFGVNKVNVHPKPMAYSSVRTPEYSVQYFINSSGFREREFLALPKAGTTRIVVIGDSFTYGTGVEQEERFTQRLETKIAATLSGRNIEVLNLGVGSYSAGQSYVLLREEALALKPDFIVFAHFANDAMEWAFLPNEAGLPDNYVVPQALWDTIHRTGEEKQTNKVTAKKKAPGWINGWAEFSAIGKLVKTSFEQWLERAHTRANKPPQSGDPRNDPFWPLREGIDLATSKNWRLHERIIGEMVRITKRQGIPFLFVAIPSGVQVNGYEWDWGRKLHGFAVGDVLGHELQQRLVSVVEKSGGRALDLTEYLRDTSTEEKRIYRPYDGHLSPHGHQVFTDAVAPIMTEMLRVPPL